MARHKGQVLEFFQAASVTDLKSPVLSDAEVVVAGVELDERVLGLASPWLRLSSEFAARCVQKNPGALAHIPWRVEGYKDIALAAILQRPSLYRCLPYHLKADVGIVRKVLSLKAQLFPCIPPALRADPELALLAIQGGLSCHEINQAGVKDCWESQKKQHCASPPGLSSAEQGLCFEHPALQPRNAGMLCREPARRRRLCGGSSKVPPRHQQVLPQFLLGDLAIDNRGCIVQGARASTNGHSPSASGGPCNRQRIN